MRISYKKLLTLLLGVSPCLWTYAQVAPTGTYTFEGDTIDAFGTISNGWSVTSTSSYAWLLNSGATGSPGTGPTVDHTLGSASGQYVYVEASGTTHISGVTTTTLESPTLDLSGFANPAIGYWYHMFGSGFGTLYIDVDDGSGWVLGVDSLVGQQQTADIDPWRFKLTSLGGFTTTSIQVRFRSVYGTSFAADASIDDISFLEMPPFDAGLSNVIVNQNYAIIPQNQFQDKQFEYEVRNVGANSISNVTVSTTETVTAFNSTSNSITSMPAGSIDTVQLASMFTNNALNVYYFESVVNITESDTVLLNDTAKYSFEVSDTVYARERGNYAGGIGFTGGTGWFGQTFEIFSTDTLTSMSVQLETPTMGDSIRFFIFNFSGGTPGTVIDSSDVFVIPSASAGQYSVTFPCDVELTPGEYFFAVHQMDTNNLGFAYSNEYYTEDKLFFSTDLVTWTDFESAGFDVTLGLRLNFGTPTGGSFTYDLGPDSTFCPTASAGVVLDATQLQATYLWSTGATTPTINVNATGTYSVTVSKCGLSSSDTVNYTAQPLPDVSLGNDTAYCENNGFNYTINLTGTPSATYAWTGGVTGPTYTFTGPGFVQVIGDLNGCEARDTIQVTEVEGLDPVNLGNDTSYCVGGTLSEILDATNIAAASYLWSTGATSPSITITSPGTYSVEVSQTGICNESFADTILIEAQQAPNVSLNDTGYCEGGSVDLTVTGGYDSYAWSSGETSESITVQNSGTYSVTVTTTAGCETVVSSVVSEFVNPVVDLGADIIDALDTVTLDAGSGYAGYLWSTGDITQTIEVTQSGTYFVTVTSTEGCQGSDEINVDANLSVASIKGYELSIYPNPVRDQLFVRYQGADQNVLVQCYSLTGALLIQESIQVGQSSTSINVSDLPSGMYVMQLEIEGESVQHRFTVH